jgi:hypothetical protein
MNYKKAYNSIINKAIKENRKKLLINDKDYVYYELHHIIPRCLNGQDNKENLVLLTAREHFLCHLFLWKLYPSNSKLLSALFIMTSHCKIDLNSRQYEKLRLNMVKTLSNLRKGKNNPMFGKNAYANKTQEEMDSIGEKISSKLKGLKKGYRVINKSTGHILYIENLEDIPDGYKRGSNIYSEESRKKMSESAKKRGNNGGFNYDKNGKNNPMFGKTHSDEVKKRIGKINKEKMTGKKWFNNGKKNILTYKCPDGWKAGRIMKNMKRVN